MLSQMMLAQCAPEAQIRQWVQSVYLIALPVLLGFMPLLQDVPSALKIRHPWGPQFLLQIAHAFRETREIREKLAQCVQKASTSMVEQGLA